MNEKLYKTLRSAGASSLILGVCVLVTGMSAGILLIINGGKLLSQKSKLLL